MAQTHGVKVAMVLVKETENNVRYMPEKVSKGKVQLVQPYSKFYLPKEIFPEGFEFPDKFEIVIPALTPAK